MTTTPPADIVESMTESEKARQVVHALHDVILDAYEKGKAVSATELTSLRARLERAEGERDILRYESDKARHFLDTFGRNNTTGHKERQRRGLAYAEARNITDTRFPTPGAKA